MSVSTEISVNFFSVLPSHDSDVCVCVLSVKCRADPNKQNRRTTKKTGGLCATLHPPFACKSILNSTLHRNYWNIYHWQLFGSQPIATRNEIIIKAWKNVFWEKFVPKWLQNVEMPLRNFIFHYMKNSTTIFFSEKKQKMRYFRDAIYSRMGCPMQDFQRFDVFVKKQKMKISCSKEEKNKLYLLNF